MFTPEHPERHEETRSTRADRDLRWYLCHVYGFFDDAGNILSFQTFGTDITARKSAEEQLAEQLGLLTAITDSAADAIFVSDGEERVTLMNPAAERIFGWSREELTGRKLHDAIHDRHPDGRPYPASECPLSRVYATGETLLRHEDVFFRKGGSPVHVACSNAPLVIEGRIAGSVLVAHDITERKRTEAALRESEARYRTAGEAIRYGVWVCNPEGGVEFVSQTFLDLIGKTLDEVKPRGWLDRLPPEDLKPTLEAWHACVRTGSEWTWEHRVKGKDGVWRTILSLGRPVRDDRDRITSWVGFNLDISARKEAEDALRESEARFRGTFENAAVGIANVGTDGAWLRVNQRLCEVLGYSRAELLQKNFQEMTHPEDLPFNLDRFTALMRGEIDTYHLEKRYLHKDGHAVWVDLTAAVQRDQAGNPAYCIRGYRRSQTRGGSCARERSPHARAARREPGRDPACVHQWRGSRHQQSRRAEVDEADGRGRSGWRSARSAPAAGPGGTEDGDRSGGRRDGDARSLRYADPLTLVRVLVLPRASGGQARLGGGRLCAGDHRAEEIASGPQQALSSHRAEPDVGRHHRPGRQNRIRQSRVRQGHWLHAGGGHRPESAHSQVRAHAARTLCEPVGDDLCGWRVAR